MTEELQPRAFRSFVLMKKNEGRLVHTDIIKTIGTEEIHGVKDGEFYAVLYPITLKDIPYEKNTLLLLARPIWILQSNNQLSLHKVLRNTWTFPGPASAATFLFGRYLENYRLYVGKRNYPWPTDISVSKISKHLSYLIETEAAFYDTPSCVEYIRQRHKTKIKWKVNDEIQIRCRDASQRR